MEKKKKRKKLQKSNIWVYKIEIDGITRYIGITNNVKRRQSQHNTGLKGDDRKELYCFLREQGIYQIELIPIIECEDRTTAKRLEMHMILSDWVGNRELKQSVPGIR